MCLAILFLFTADSWPQSFDDSNARREWGWKHEYDLELMCQTMIEALAPKHTEKRSSVL